MNHRTLAETSPFPTRSETIRWDRRRSPRLSAAESRLWLGWRKDDDFFVIGAQLMNVSQGGALLLVAEPPPKGEMVWLRLEDASPIEDVSATVIEATRIGRGEHGVRLSFREPFPLAFYRAAVAGLQALHHREASALK